MKHSVLIFAAQGIAALVLLAAAALKFAENPTSVAVFEELGMEPGGRVVIAVVELLAGMLLISPLAAIGSVLAVCVMFGAIIAHLTQLGVVVAHDGGMAFGALMLVLLCSSYVLVQRRKELPLIGGTL